MLCGFLIDYAIYAALVASGVSVYLANVAAFAVGTTVNVLLIRRFVFPGARFRLGADVGLTFAANGAMLAVGTAILWVLVEALQMNPYVAKLVANGITFVLNYWTRVLYFSKA